MVENLRISKIHQCFYTTKKLWVLKNFSGHNIVHRGPRYLKVQRNLSLLKISIGMNKDQCVSLTMTHNVEELSTSNCQILIALTMTHNVQELSFPIAKY